MKTMIVTGASRGIGAATAILAVDYGFAVVVNYRKNKPAAQKVAKIAWTNWKACLPMKSSAYFITWT